MARLLVPVGWLLASIGSYGAWIAHPAAALTLSGVDLAEFVKFLPGVVDGSLPVMREWFYLPPFALAVSIALLIGSHRLGYFWVVRVAALTLAIPISLQLLPPAWSPSSLQMTEFRLQTIALGICWLLLAGFWLLAGLPFWLTSLASAALSVVAITLPTWQLLVIKPAIDRVYGTSPAVGWGFSVCMIGLAVMALGSVLPVLRTRTRRTAL